MKKKLQLCILRKDLAANSSKIFNFLFKRPIFFLCKKFSNNVIFAKRNKNAIYLSIVVDNDLTM